MRPISREVRPSDGGNRTRHRSPRWRNLSADARRTNDATLGITYWPSIRLTWRFFRFEDAAWSDLGEGVRVIELETSVNSTSMEHSLTYVNDIS